MFGYDNVPVEGGKRHRINEAEAAVVREIYARYAAGLGFRAIAHELNARRVPAPRPQRGRPAGWDPGTIRKVLGRQLYRGVAVWNRSKKRDAAGDQRQPPRPESDWETLPMPHLRIVDEAVAAAVDERRTDRRNRYLRAPGGRIIGRTGTTTGKYLLSGPLRCPCGGSFEAQRHQHGKRPGNVYICSTRRRKGPSVCSVDVALPIAETDDAIPTVIEGDVLNADVVDRILESAFAPSTDREALEAERRTLGTEITNLTAAIAAGGEIAALVDALRDRDRRLKAIDVRLTAREAPDREQLRTALTQRVDGWRAILRSENPAQARMVLQHLVGPIHLFRERVVFDGDEVDAVNFVPGRSLELIPWAASSNPAGLLTGLVQRMASPTGSDTDGDGRGHRPTSVISTRAMGSVVWATRREACRAD